MGRTARLRTLTTAHLRAYMADAGQTRPLHDGGGLYLRKRDASARWYLRMTDPATGAEQWHVLFRDDPGGGYPDKGLADARREADRLRAIRSEGHDPRALRAREIRERKAEAERATLEAQRRLTVRQVFERWAATDLRPYVGADGRRIGRKDGGQYAREQFERRVFPQFGSVPVQDVTKADLLAVLDAAKAEGKLRTANVLLANLKQMLRFALVRELIERNPLDTVTRRDVGGKETERARVLTADEITALAGAVPGANMAERSALAVWLILATGVRVGEAMGARWEHVDTVARTWHLPETKNQRPHTVHLSSFALRQIEALAALRGTCRDERGNLVPSPWVFPNSEGTGPVCVKSFGKQLADRQRPADRRMQRRSKLTGSLALPGGKWTAHDLRRTAATLMAELGISGDVIDECLNHVIESRVRRTYIRDRREADQARAFDALGTRLESLVLGERAMPSNVLALRAA